MDGHLEVNELEVSGLTSYDVAFDGSKARLGMLDAAAQPVSLFLPYALIRSLVLTLPSIQAKALQAQSGDDALRLVYPIGGWSLERTELEGPLMPRQLHEWERRRSTPKKYRLF